MAEYAFLSIWELEAPIERVWDAIRTVESYPAWFPAVQRVELLQSGDSEGVGTVTRSWWSTALPYGFSFDLRTTRVEAPSLLEVDATGELVGTGRWELATGGGRTTVRYFWNVAPAKRWMNLLAPVARPAFAWNHAIVMQAGGAGLARWLGVALRSSRSYTAESTSPIWALINLLGTLALLILLAGRLRPGRRRG
jgi:uncharacterized protein YndB with AHSA1/START domain